DPRPVALLRGAGAPPGADRAEAPHRPGVPGRPGPLLRARAGAAHQRRADRPYRRLIPRTPVAVGRLIGLAVRSLVQNLSPHFLPPPRLSSHPSARGAGRRRHLVASFREGPEPPAGRDQHMPRQNDRSRAALAAWVAAGGKVTTWCRANEVPIRTARRWTKD